MGIFRFTSEFSGAAESVNVWHFITAGVPTLTQANEAVDAVDAFFTAIAASLAAGTWTHGSRVTTVDQTPNFVLPATAETTTTTAGSPAPLQVAAGITWHTAFIGKSYQGRSYVGPLGSAVLGTLGTAITSGFATTLGGAATALMAPTTNGATLCVWSEKLQLGNAVVANTTHLGYRTQRRRLT